MTQTNQKQLKILFGAYSCDPYRGSEPGVGWNFVTGVAKYHKVHVLVNALEFQQSLTKYCEDYPEAVKNITFHFIPATFYPLLRKIYPPSFYHFYRKWQKRAYKYAVELDKKENFDLVHQVTLAGFREPGYLWKLGKPYIIGPLGGFTQTSWRLLPGLGLHGIFFFGMRNILNSIQKRFGFAAKTLPKHADAIIVSDNYGAEDVKRFWKRECYLMQEVGTSPQTINPKQTRRKDGEPLRICWAGLFVPLKALQFLLQALTFCKHPMELNVLGGGPNGAAWKKLTNKLNLSDKVHFKGFIPRNDVLEIMANSHVLCITSIKEGGTGTVVLEALQNGLPIICLDHCGVASVVNERIGIKIPIKSRKQIIKDFAKSLDYLYENENERYQMAEYAANFESKKYTWDQKIKQLLDIYKQVLEQKR